MIPPMLVIIYNGNRGAAGRAHCIGRVGSQVSITVSSSSARASSIGVMTMVPREEPAGMMIFPGSPLRSLFGDRGPSHVVINRQGGGCASGAADRESARSDTRLGGRGISGDHGYRRLSSVIIYNRNRGASGRGYCIRSVGSQGKYHRLIVFHPSIIDRRDDDGAAGRIRRDDDISWKPIAVTVRRGGPSHVVINRQGGGLCFRCG